MIIVQEQVDLDKYIEISLSEKELNLLKEYMIMTKPFYHRGERVILSIKLGMYEDFDDENTEIWT